MNKLQTATEIHADLLIARSRVEGALRLALDLAHEDGGSGTAALLGEVQNALRHLQSATTGAAVEVDSQRSIRLARDLAAGQSIYYPDGNDLTADSWVRVIGVEVVDHGTGVTLVTQDSLGRQFVDTINADREFQTA